MKHQKHLIHSSEKPDRIIQPILTGQHHKREKQTISPFKYRLISLKLFIFSTVPIETSHGAELLWGAAKYGATSLAYYLPESTKTAATNALSSIVGDGKDFDNRFKEYVANRNITQLNDLIVEFRDLYEKKALIHSNQNSYNFNIHNVCETAESARNLLLKYSLALLSIEYTDLCKRTIEEKIETIQKIQNVSNDWELIGDSTETQKKEEAKIMLEYLQKLKLNLAAALYAKYKYDRQGGAYDRVTTSVEARKKRAKFWGVSDIPPLDLSPIPDSIKKIATAANDGRKTQLADIVSNVFDTYKKTLDFLTTPAEEIIECNNAYENLDLYKQQFYQLFNQYSPEEKITSDLVNAYNLVRDTVKTKPIAIAQPSRISRRSSSQSFSAGSSSVPSSFGAAVRASQHAKNTATSPKRSSQNVGGQEITAEQKAYLNSLVEDYNPKTTPDNDEEFDSQDGSYPDNDSFTETSEESDILVMK